MALAGVSGRSRRTFSPDESTLKQQKIIAMQALSPLYESIDFVARSLVDRLQHVDVQLLPRTVNLSSIEFKTSLRGDWNEFFRSTDEINQTLADGMWRVNIGISSGLMLGGFKQCRVKKIVLDTEAQRFIIDLHWVTEPSRLKKLLTRHH